jgi:hypothetical protein
MSGSSPSGWGQRAIPVSPKARLRTLALQGLVLTVLVGFAVVGALLVCIGHAESAASSWDFGADVDPGRLLFWSVASGTVTLALGVGALRLRLFRSLACLPALGFFVYVVGFSILQTLKDAPSLPRRLSKSGRLALTPDGGRMLTSGPRHAPCAGIAIYRNTPPTVQAGSHRFFRKDQHVRIDGVNRTPELFLPIPVSSRGLGELYRVILYDVLFGRGDLPETPFGRLLPLAVIGDGGVGDCRKRQGE